MPSQKKKVCHMQTITKSEGSPIPAPSNEGTGTASIVSEQETVKVCPYRYLGCASEEYGRCFNGVCDPIDAVAGQRFTVRVTEAHGQKFYAKVYDKIIDAEEIQRARVQSILARQDEPLPTWRHRQSGCTITEEAI